MYGDPIGQLRQGISRQVTAWQPGFLTYRGSKR
jgi:hypothetical protein